MNDKAGRKARLNMNAFKCIISRVDFKNSESNLLYVELSPIKL